MKILIIDDENQNDLEKALHRLNHSTHYEKFLDNALKYIMDNRWSIDLILLDEVFGNQLLKSKFKNGASFAKYINTNTELHHIPIVTITANKYEIEKGIELMAECGVVYFIQKEYFEFNLEGCLEKIRSLPNLQKCWILRSKEKKELLLQIFGNLNDNLRKKISEYGKVGSVKILDETITYNLTTATIKEWLAGWIDIQDCSDKKTLEKVLELLHETNSTVQFQGNWSKENSPERIELTKYFERNDYGTISRSIDFKAVNYLLEVLDIKDCYNGQENIRMEYNSIKELTKRCTLNNGRSFHFFIDKMIGRRVLLCYQSIYPMDYNENLTIRNLVRLFKLGDTGTYEIIETETGLIIKEYNNFPAACKRKNIINTALGLCAPLSAQIPYEVRNSDGKFITKKMSLSPVLLDIHYVLREEQKFVDKYANILPLIHDFIVKIQGEYRVEYHFNANFVDLAGFQKFLETELKGHKDCTKILKETFKFLEENFPGVESIIRDVVSFPNCK